MSRLPQIALLFLAIGLVKEAAAEGIELVIGIDTNQIPADTDLTAEQANAIKVFRKRLQALGIRKHALSPVDRDRILVQLPGLSAKDKQDEVRRVLGRGAFLSIHLVHPDSDRLVAEGITVWPGYTNMIELRRMPDGTTQRLPHWVNKKPERGLTGKFLKSAMVARDRVIDKPEIDFELDADGARLFEEITREYQPKDTSAGRRYYHLAILLDGELYSAPRIMEPISGGRVRISGNFAVKEAFELANVLENPLAAPFQILAVRPIDPAVEKAFASRAKQRAVAIVTLTLVVASLLVAAIFFLAGWHTRWREAKRVYPVSSHASAGLKPSHESTLLPPQH